VAGEANTVRIGGDTGFGSQIATFIAGIAGKTVGAGGTTCYVDNNGKLGVILSARRYKENIQRMDDASAVLFSLKPVTFRYKAEFDESGTPQFGLIAEEVAQVSPDLVTHDGRGELSTVRYEAINAMLLNEFLKEHRKVEEQTRKIQEQEATITELKSAVAQQQKEFHTITAEQRKQIQGLAASLKEQAAQIQNVSTEMEANKFARRTAGRIRRGGPAPRMVLNNEVEAVQ
jgi:hypothetical protein